MESATEPAKLRGIPVLSEGAGEIRDRLAALSV